MRKVGSGSRSGTKNGEKVAYSGDGSFDASMTTNKTNQRAQLEIKKMTPGEREELLDECEEALEKLVRERMEGNDSFAEYEQSILEIAHDVVRRRLEKKLQTMADRIEHRVLIDHTNDWHGIREGTAFYYRRHALGTATYHSLVGGLKVQRHTYRECYRGGTTYVPLELEAGLMERMTPALAKSLAIGYAYMPTRQCEQFMRASGLQPPSRSTLDRAARDLGDYAVAANETIEPRVRANEIVDRRVQSISVGLDRTAVPMRHGESDSGSRCYVQRDLRQSRPKPRKQAHLRGPVKWRMDYVGTVAMLDAQGSPIVTRKYRGPAAADPESIVARMMADLRHALAQRPVTVSVVQDGAPELWRALERGLGIEPLVHGWTEVLDWYHLDERLGRCLDLCEVPASRRASQRKRWHAQLLQTDSGLKHVIRSFRRQSKKLDPASAAEVAQHINYLKRNKRRTHYATYQAAGIPIGSGITEGACKSVIAARAKRSGQRWSQRGLTAALHLRTIHQSERFDSFWEFFRRRYRGNIVPLIGNPSAGLHLEPGGWTWRSHRGGQRRWHEHDERAAGHQSCGRGGQPPGGRSKRHRMRLGHATSVG